MRPKVRHWIRNRQTHGHTLGSLQTKRRTENRCVIKALRLVWNYVAGSDAGKPDSNMIESFPVSPDGRVTGHEGPNGMGWSTLPGSYVWLISQVWPPRSFRSVTQWVFFFFLDLFKIRNDEDNSNEMSLDAVQAPSRSACKQKNGIICCF